MTKRLWKRHHKWLGIGISFFILMFCLSGIILNHRHWIANINVNRGWLPTRYEYKDWNGGLLRGSIKTSLGQDKQQVLIYGTGGIWLTDSTASTFEDFNTGLPIGADYHQIRNMLSIYDRENPKENTILAVSPFALYLLSKYHSWQIKNLPLEEEDKLTDIAHHNDTLVALSRSFAYVSLPPYKDFKRIQLPKPILYDGKATAFRTVWLLHNGELFGFWGKMTVDFIAIILIVLCITGILFWLLPKYIKHKKQKAKPSWTYHLLKHSLIWHNNIGKYTIIFTLFICITGWCLRPPVMIPLVLNKIPSIPGTTLHSDNPWKDKLRMIRYDEACHDWILHTSDGFYAVKSLNDLMHKSSTSSHQLTLIQGAPPVSVMGLNVLEKDQQGNWLCGSFSGMYVWNRERHISTDYFTKKLAPKTSGTPFGKKAITGYSKDFQVPLQQGRHGIITEYYKGTQAIKQPIWMNRLPISLWNVALEIHSGRIFIGDIATYIFIFVMGILVIWCLWSGYKVRKKH